MLRHEIITPSLAVCVYEVAEFSRKGYIIDPDFIPNNYNFGQYNVVMVLAEAHDAVAAAMFSPEIEEEFKETEEIKETSGTAPPKRRGRPPRVVNPANATISL